MNKKSLLLAAAGLAVASSAFAQRDNRTFEDEVVTIIVNEDSADPAKVEQAFKENAPTTPRDNGLPRFAIVGKDHQFYIGVGAQFLGEGVYDFGGDMPSTLNFTPSSLVAPAPGNDGNLGFAWQSSSIYMNIVAMPHTDNSVGIFFKGNFTGNGNAFNCSHFYAKYRGLTVGYTNSAFTDGAAMPYTIDNEGPNGYPSLSLFTAYWQQNFGHGLSGAIGIDAPSADLTTTSASSQINQRIPAVPLYVQYAWAGGASHVRLSGLVRPLQYRNLATAKNNTLVGLGAQVSGMTSIVGNLSMQYNIAYGCGIGDYIQDDNGLGLDATPTATAGKLAMVKTMGVTGGLSYAFSKKATANVSYSHVTNWLGDNALTEADQYRHGDYLAANVVLNINKFVSAGVEYDYGCRKSFDGKSLHDNRIQCQLAVTF